MFTLIYMSARLPNNKTLVHNSKLKWLSLGPKMWIP